jgi:hypothetical protein
VELGLWIGAGEAQAVRANATNRGLVIAPASRSSSESRSAPPIRLTMRRSSLMRVRL